MRRASRGGWVLLEVLLALVVLGISAAAIATTLHEVSTVLTRASDAERRLESAERLLNRYAARTGAELERSVGRWTEAGLGVRISRLNPTLFEILIVQPGGQVALETALYRPRHDPP
jgi:type II secretory pathway pseudopilin PulG